MIFFNRQIYLEPMKIKSFNSFNVAICSDFWDVLANGYC
jgi:hypothetical protein